MLLDARASFLNTYVLKSGDSMSGALTVGGALTVDGYDALVRMAGADVWPDMRVRAVSTSGAPGLAFDRARGTAFGSESAVQAWDDLGWFYGLGHDGSDYGDSVAIRFGAAENFTGSAHGGYFEFKAVPAGSTSLVNVMTIYGHEVVVNEDSGDVNFRVESDGDASMLLVDAGNNRVGIRASPAATLHIDQKGSSQAVPVLLLDQADVDYVLVKVVATAEAASADRTLVAASDFSTPGALAGWIQIEIDDAGNRITDGDYYIPFYAVPTA